MMIAGWIPALLMLLVVIVSSFGGDRGVHALLLLLLPYR
jgi:uncharacterized membrane protein